MLFFVVMAIAFILITVRVAWLQTAQSANYATYGASQRVRSVILPASRGTIFDRNGIELAVSVPHTTVWADPRLMKDKSFALGELVRVLGLDAVKATELAIKFNSATEFVYIRRQVADDAAQMVRDLKLPGVFFLTEPKRFAPAGESGRSIIGYTDLDGNGTAGIEMTNDALLTGTPGELIRERDSQGRSIASGQHATTPPKPGQDVILTIDRRLQYRTEQMLVEQVNDTRARGGMVVVLDAKSGDVLAMASVRRSDSTGDVQVTSANLAVVDTYEPGSVAKIIAASGALEEGTTDLTKSWEIPSSLKVFDAVITDDDPHGTISLTVPQIIAESSNIGTVKLAQSIGSLNVEKYLRSFGFGATSGLDFPGESAGLLPPYQKWSGTQRATIAYGQGIGVTGIQMAAAMNVIANKGVYVAPRLVMGTIDDAGVERSAEPSATHQVIRPDTAELMNSVLRGVVCFGTARETARIEGYPVAGKTGTAFKAQPWFKGQTDGYLDKDGKRHYYASFAGFVPADDPQLTILVSIDEPDSSGDLRYGRTAAAPLFTTVASEALRSMKIPPRAEGTGCAKAPK